MANSAHSYKSNKNILKEITTLNLQWRQENFTAEGKGKSQEQSKL